MKLICALLLLDHFVVSVDALKIEANHGEDVKIPLIDKAEEAGRLRITFTSETTKEIHLIADNCTGSESCDVVETPGVSLFYEKGRVSVIIQKVNSSRSGLYKARAFFGNEVCDVNATLVVKEAPVSSSAAPPHSPTPKPPNSDLHWLWLVLVFAVVISGGVYFCKHKRTFQESQKQMLNPQKPLLSPDPESANERESGEPVAMNGCGENGEALLTDT